MKTDRLMAILVPILIEAAISGFDVAKAFALARTSEDVTQEMWDNMMSDWDETMDVFKGA